jgi:hypothetical protein
MVLSNWLSVAMSGTSLYERTLPKHPSDASQVEFEIEREGQEVVLSVRSIDSNFVLALPLDGAVTACAALMRAIDEDSSPRSRFIISRARLQVSK